MGNLSEDFCYHCECKKFKPKENVCECGHDEDKHRSGKYDRRGINACVHESRCPCKKFKPKICPQCDMGVSSCLCKQKGCGKEYTLSDKDDCSWENTCGDMDSFKVVQLCPECEEKIK